MSNDVIVGEGANAEKKDNVDMASPGEEESDGKNENENENENKEEMRQGLKHDVGTYTMVSVDDLLVSEYNVRKSAEDAKVEETNINTLTANISQYGLVNPLTVCQSVKHPGKYEILAGQRRFKALKTLQWTDVPCRVVECTSPEQAAMIGLAENVQRLPMSIRDKCKAIKTLFDLHNGDLDAVVKMTNLSQITVKRYLNLSQNLAVSLHGEFDEDGKLTLGVANLLTQVVPDTKRQEEVFEAIKDLSTSGQKQEVLKLLGDDPDADVGEVVNQVREKDVTRKRFMKIKKEPWCYDINQEPVAIPKQLFPQVFNLIKSSAGVVAAAPKPAKRGRRQRNSDDDD